MAARIDPGLFLIFGGVARTSLRRPIRIGGRAISEKQLRVNETIRTSPVRLIDDEGDQVGIVSLDEAREHARAAGLDMVEVAPEARPPVVRLMDFGEWKCRQAEATREARRRRKRMQAREIEVRPGIEESDYRFKIRHARRFLADGDEVKVTVQSRGPGETDPVGGRHVLDRMTQELDDVADVEREPALRGRTVTMVLSPRKTKAK